MSDASRIPRRTALARLGGAAALALLGACRSRGAEAAKAPESKTESRAVSSNRTRMPVVYLPHGGGPCFFMARPPGPPGTWDAMADYLRGLPAVPPHKPKALLVVSAHWEEDVPTVISSAKPPLLYDYYGFPEETYALQWPAPGSPAVAARVRELLTAAGIKSAETTERGLDHGVFIPLKLSWPEAEIPTVQLSLQRGLDPAAHVAMGKALAPLRDEGVFIIGSGMSYHNLRRMGRDNKASSQRFDDWLTEAVTKPAQARDAQLADWKSAPHARECHPREEHLIPLMVAAGAAGEDIGTVPFRSHVLGAVVAAHHFG